MKKDTVEEISFRVDFKWFSNMFKGNLKIHHMFTWVFF